MSPPTSALVLGARGQLGRALLPRLAAAGWDVHAAGRQPQADEPALHWHRLDLFADADALPATDVLFSLGPLDGAAAWFARSRRVPRTVVAFGSTSVHVKNDSPDRAERDVARRLRDAEETLTRACEARGTRLVLLRPTLVYGAGRDRNLTRIATLARACAQRGATLVLLRPTLIYGAGRDRNLTRIARLARRWGFVALPRGAVGLRQPVHVDDLADAAWRCATADRALATAYDLPGGEALPYREMVARVLACFVPAPKLIELPSGPLRAALWCAHRVGMLGDAGAGVWSRLTSDLVFDAQPARRDFGYAPRPFAPHASMFDATKGMLQRTM